MNLVFRLLHRRHVAPSVVRVPLSQGLYALIDACDWPKIAAHTWCAYRSRRTHYAQRAVYAGGQSTTLKMHRLIAGVPDGVDVDHKNGNGLDNRRRNLRAATQTQNNGNRRLHSNNTSGFKGVSWHKRGAKWLASIRINQRAQHLGLFTDPVEAAHAYDSAARLHFGEFSAVNFPQPGERRASAAGALARLADG